MIALEFGFYKPVLDVFFKKKTAGNVYGVRKSNGETKKRIILCAHTDSAYEWKYTYKTGRKGNLLSYIYDYVFRKGRDYTGNDI